MKKIISSIFIMLAICGCAEINVRLHPSSFQSTIYPAVEYDCNAINTLYSDDWLGNKLILPIAVVDIVPSVIVDTMFLPFDVYEFEK